MTINTRPNDQGALASPDESDDAAGLLVKRLKSLVDRLGVWTAVASLFYRNRAEIESIAYDQAHVDRVIVGWWFVLVASYLLAYHQVAYIWPLAVAAAALRIANIAFWNLRVALVQTRKTTDGVVVLVTDIERSLILGIVAFLELIIAYACIYAAFPNCVHLPDKEVATAGVYLYFSSITQLTIGYGDVTPLSWLRLITVVQGFSGLALLIVTIGRFVALVRVKEAGRG